MARVRLDSLLAERGLFDSRSRAAAAVLAGDVMLLPGRRRAEKPGQLVAADVELEVAAAPAYVSRGGVKLANALDAFGLDVAGRRALDVGASTGGFTDCLLQRGAEAVTAVDVAYGQHWTLREDPRVTVLERVNARTLDCARLAHRPDLVVADVSFISLAKVLPAVLACTAERFDALVMVKPQFEVGRQLVGRGGVVRDPALRRAALVGVARAGQGAGAAVLGFASSGLPGPKGNRETFAWLAEAGRAGAVADVEAAALEAEPGMRATVLTHRGGRDISGAIGELLDTARAEGVTLCVDAEEARKHRLEGEPGIEVCPASGDADLCVVLGGDGTILAALRQYAGTDVPVFAVNYGEVGFLATMDPDGVRHGLTRAFRGEFETMAMPAITIGRPEGSWHAFNDISVHRLPGNRVADLAYALGGDEIGRVRCDGLVVATPAGSTGYNLANGGPVLAWGVQGYVVSFIAPHSFTARALVVAPTDVLTINNSAPADPAEVHVDGRPTCMLPAGQDLTVQFGREQARLALLPGANFYHRLRERFGRLAR